MLTKPNIARKIIVRGMAYLLIEAFLLPNFAWAGQKWDAWQIGEKSTLSPQIALSDKIVQNDISLISTLINAYNLRQNGETPSKIRQMLNKSSEVDFVRDIDGGILVALHISGENRYFSVFKQAKTPRLLQYGRGNRIALIQGLTISEVNPADIQKYALEKFLPKERLSAKDFVKDIMPAAALRHAPRQRLELIISDLARLGDKEMVFWFLSYFYQHHNFFGQYLKEAFYLSEQIIAAKFNLRLAIYALPKVFNLFPEEQREIWRISAYLVRRQIDPAGLFGQFLLNKDLIQELSSPQKKQMLTHLAGLAEKGIDPAEVFMYQPLSTEKLGQVSFYKQAGETLTPLISSSQLAEIDKLKRYDAINYYYYKTTVSRAYDHQDVDAYVVVARDNYRVVGMRLVLQDEDSPPVSAGVYVHPAYRNLNIATNLTEYALRIVGCEIPGADRIVANSETTGGKRLLDKFGEGRMPRFSIDGALTDSAFRVYSIELTQSMREQGREILSQADEALLNRVYLPRIEQGLEMIVSAEKREARLLPKDQDFIHKNRTALVERYISTADALSLEELKSILSGKKAAIYPGYFNEFNGSQKDVIKRGLAGFDYVVVAVIPGDGDEREMREKRLKHIRRQLGRNKKVFVVGLSERSVIADLAKELGTNVILRRLRQVPPKPEQLDAESKIAKINYEQYGLETLFIVPANKHLRLAPELIINYLTPYEGLLKGFMPAGESLNHFAEWLAALEKFSEQRKRKTSKVSEKTAVYAGSFDPVTNGHMEVIERASKIYEELYVVVGLNPGKEYMFDEDKRVSLMEKAIKQKGLSNVQVIKWQGLIVDAARNTRAGVMIKGARDIEDLGYEMPLAWASHILDEGVQTQLLVPYRFEDVSSSAVKEKWRKRQGISLMVPYHVYWTLRKKDLEKIRGNAKIIGITGGILTGKSETMNLLKQMGAYTIKLDDLAEEVRSSPQVKPYIVELFGREALDERGRISRDKLGKIVFADKNKLKQLTDLLYPAINSAVFKMVLKAKYRGEKLIAIEGTNLFDAGMDIIMDEIWAITADDETRFERMKTDPKRKHLDEEKLRDILALLPDQKIFVEKASRQIENSGTSEALKAKITAAVSQGGLGLELREVVDRDGNCIDIKDRDLIHRQGLLHRSAVILMFNQQGKLLVTRRARGKIEEGTWGIIGGHCELNEVYSAAAMRETKEETGIAMDPARFKRLERFHVDRFYEQPERVRNNELMEVFMYALTPEEEAGLSLDPREMTEGRFVDIEDVTGWAMTDIIKYAPAKGTLAYVGGLELIFGNREHLAAIERFLNEQIAGRAKEKEPLPKIEAVSQEPLDLLDYVLTPDKYGADWQDAQLDLSHWGTALSLIQEIEQGLDISTERKLQEWLVNLDELFAYLDMFLNEDTSLYLDRKIVPLDNNEKALQLVRMVAQAQLAQRIIELAVPAAEKLGKLDVSYPTHHFLMNGNIGDFIAAAETILSRLNDYIKTHPQLPPKVEKLIAQQLALRRIVWAEDITGPEKKYVNEDIDWAANIKWFFDEGKDITDIKDIHVEKIIEPIKKPRLPAGKRFKTRENRYKYWLGQPSTRKWLVDILVKKFLTDNRPFYLMSNDEFSQVQARYQTKGRISQEALVEKFNELKKGYNPQAEAGLWQLILEKTAIAKLYAIYKTYADKEAIDPINAVSFLVTMTLTNGQSQQFGIPGRLESEFTPYASKTLIQAQGFFDKVEYDWGKMDFGQKNATAIQGLFKEAIKRGLLQPEILEEKLEKIYDNKIKLSGLAAIKVSYNSSDISKHRAKVSFITPEGKELNMDLIIGMGLDPKDFGEQSAQESFEALYKEFDIFDKIEQISGRMKIVPQVTPPRRHVWTKQKGEETYVLPYLEVWQESIEGRTLKEIRESGIKGMELEEIERQVVFVITEFMRESNKMLVGLTPNKIKIYRNEHNALMVNISQVGVMEDIDFDNLSAIELLRYLRMFVDNPKSIAAGLGYFYERTGSFASFVDLFDELRQYHETLKQELKDKKWRDFLINEFGEGIEHMAREMLPGARNNNAVAWLGPKFVGEKLKLIRARIEGLQQQLAASRGEEKQEDIANLPARIAKLEELSQKYEWYVFEWYLIYKYAAPLIKTKYIKGEEQLPLFLARFEIDNDTKWEQFEKYYEALNELKKQKDDFNPTPYVAVSDLHARIDILDKVIAHAIYGDFREFQPDKKLVDQGIDLAKINLQFLFGGDYINKGGYYGLRVLRRVRELVDADKAVALWGNHDFLMLGAFLGDADCTLQWMIGGGGLILAELGIIEVNEPNEEKRVEKIKDISADITANLLIGNKDERIEQFRQSDEMRDMINWMRENLRLYHINKYGQMITHAAIPMNDRRQVAAEYKGRNGYLALKEMQTDMQQMSLKQLGRVIPYFSEPADSDMPVKPSVLQARWNEVDAQQVREQFGTSQFFYGHISRRQFWHAPDIVGNDFGLASIGALDEGGYIISDKDGQRAIKFKGSDAVEVVSIRSGEEYKTYLRDFLSRRLKQLAKELDLSAALVAGMGIDEGIKGRAKKAAIGEASEASKTGSAGKTVENAQLDLFSNGLSHSQALFDNVGYDWERLDQFIESWDDDKEEIQKLFRENLQEKLSDPQKIEQGLSDIYCQKVSFYDIQSIGLKYITKGSKKHIATIKFQMADGTIKELGLIIEPYWFGSEEAAIAQRQEYELLQRTNNQPGGKAVVPILLDWQEKEDETTGMRYFTALVEFVGGNTLAELREDEQYALEMDVIEATAVSAYIKFVQITGISLADVTAENFKLVRYGEGKWYAKMIDMGIPEEEGYKPTVGELFWRLKKIVDRGKGEGEVVNMRNVVAGVFDALSFDDFAGYYNMLKAEYDEFKQSIRKKEKYLRTWHKLDLPGGLLPAHIAEKTKQVSVVEAELKSKIGSLENDSDEKAKLVDFSKTLTSLVSDYKRHVLIRELLVYYDEIIRTYSAETAFIQPQLELSPEFAGLVEQAI